MSRRGHSLIELIVASAIASLLFVILLGLLFPSLRLGMQLYARSQQLQETVVALRHLEEDLGQTAPSGLFLSANQVVIQPLDWVTPDLSCSWQSQWIGYAQQGQQLLRQVGPAAGSKPDWDATHAQLPAQPGSVQWVSATVLLASLKQMQVTLPTGPLTSGSAPVVTVHLVLTDVSDPAASVDVSEQIQLRNPGL